MNRKVTILTIISIFIISITSLFTFEVVQKQKYLIENRYKTQNYIVLDSLIKTEKDLYLLNEVAINSNVGLIVKSQENNKTHYFLDDATFKKIKDNMNITEIVTSISTFNTDKSSYIIRDFMGNDFYTYSRLTLDHIANNRIIVTSNNQDFEIFSSQIESFFSISSINFVSSTVAYIENMRGLDVVIINIIIMIMTILSISISMIFVFFNRSKKIGVLLQLGLSSKQIYKVLMKKTLLVMAFAIITNILLATLLVKNITLNYTLLFSVILVVYVGIIQILIYGILIFIINRINIASLVKEKRITGTYLRISNALKTCFFIVFLILMTVSFEIMYQVVSKRAQYNYFNEINDEYVIYSFQLTANSPYLFMASNEKLELSEKVYTKLDELFDVSYVELGFNYNKIDEHDIGIVDINATNKLNLISESQRKIFFEQIPENKTILIPISLIEKKEEIKEYFKRGHQESELQLIYYEDTCIQTYNFNYNKCSQAPVLEVSSKDEFILWNIFGLNIDTPLKIQANDSKAIYTSIKDILYEYEVEGLIKENNINTVKQVKDSNLSSYEHNLYFFVIGSIACIGIYLIINSKSNMLYLLYNQKQISVKRLLGYGDEVIFKGRILTWLTIDLFLLLSVSVVYTVVKKDLYTAFFFISMFILVLVINLVWNGYELKKGATKLVKEKLRGD